MNKVAPVRRSYARDEECGYGTCAATVDCTGPCAMKSLPVIDEKFLDEQIQMLADDYQSQGISSAGIAAAVVGILVFVTVFAASMAFK